MVGVVDVVVRFFLWWFISSSFLLLKWLIGVCICRLVVVRVEVFWFVFSIR